MPNDLTSEILAELRRVIERYGIESDGLDLTDTQALNRLLESHGADIYLLCTIGSWHDTMTDEEVLQDLRDWLNKGPETLRPNPSFARAI